MSGQYKAGIAVGVAIGVAVYFILIYALPIMGKWNWMFT
jgi:Na+-transporting methylmalonyl-CoA/oxaloacetate decarboxylase gamma subunit